MKWALATERATNLFIRRWIGGLRDLRPLLGLLSCCSASQCSIVRVGALSVSCAVINTVSMRMRVVATLRSKRMGLVHRMYSLKWIYNCEHLSLNKLDYENKWRYLFKK